MSDQCWVKIDQWSLINKQWSGCTAAQCNSIEFTWMRVGCVAQGREAGQPADRPQRAPGAGGLRLVSEARRGWVRALERGGRHARLHLARDPPRAPHSPLLLVLHLWALTDPGRARRQWRTDTASTAANATGGVWYVLSCLLPPTHTLTLNSN